MTDLSLMNIPSGRSLPKSFYFQSFYLPGSVDVHDQQLEQWNKKTPPLYLWSRPDWTARHREIAQQQGHIFNEQNYAETRVDAGKSNYFMEENKDCYYDVLNEISLSDDLGGLYDDIPGINYEPEAEGNGAVKYRARHEAEILAQGDLNGENVIEDDMCIDMELSTPPASPFRLLP